MSEVAARDWACNALVSKAISEPSPSVEVMLSAAAEEGILALLNDSVDRMPAEFVSTEFRVALRGAARVETAKELLRMSHAREVVAALSVMGIATLVLKGTAMAYWLYAEPSHRPRCDLDLLVESREAAQRAVAVLQGEDYAVVADVGVASSAEFEVALQRRTPGGLVHTIDLHWRLVNHASLSRGFTFSELWAGRIPIPKLHAQAFGLGRVHALVHALLHRVTNFPSGTQDRLIWLYDIHLLAGGFGVAEWDSVLTLCAGKGIATPCLDGLNATRTAFGTTVPEAVITAMQAMTAAEAWHMGLALDQGAMDRAHLAALSWPDRAGWLWRKLFPSHEFMRYRYGATGIAGLARAYLVRWWVGIRRGLGWH